MSKVIEVADRTFDEEVLESDMPTEVDFWAPWCVPCGMVSPIYDKLAKEYVGKFKFCKINVDENPQTAVKYQVMSIPMQMYFAGGQKVDEILGAVPEHTIRTKIEDVLRSFPADERGRLEMLLTSWTEQNKGHSEKLRKWAEKANSIEANPTYDNILQAAREMEKANGKLSEVLRGL